MTFSIEDYTSTDLRPAEEAQLLKITALVDRICAAADAVSDKRLSEQVKINNAARRGRGPKRYRTDIEAVILADPHGKPTELSRRANCSRDTLTKYRKRMREEGRI